MRGPLSQPCALAKSPLPLQLGPQERGKPPPRPGHYFTSGASYLRGGWNWLSGLSVAALPSPQPCGPQTLSAPSLPEASELDPPLVSQGVALGSLHPQPFVWGKRRSSPSLHTVGWGGGNVVKGKVSVSSLIAFQQDCHSSSSLSAPLCKGAWVG